jgi:macrolide transport system ATP-binding/permease protein
MDIKTKAHIIDGQAESDRVGMDQPLLQLIGVSRTFQTGNDTVIALRDLTLSIGAGEFVAIVGASGSGKSTLMNVLGCMDKPTQGSYLIDGEPTEAMTADELAALRNRHFGFVFQRYLLLPGLSALQNVEMPAIYGAEGPSSRRKRAAALLQAVGLGERRGHLPNQLSGGQQQRVALARALMNGGQVILADEPTGALDSHSATEVMRLLHRLHERGRTVIIVTHDMSVASHAERIIQFSDGRVVSDRRNESRPSAPVPAELPASPGKASLRGWSYWAEMLRLAWQEVLIHRLRTGLTILGIAIGVTVVLCVQALLDGGQEEVMRELRAMGSRSIHIFPGTGPGDRRADAVETLVPDDARALKGQAYVDTVTPLLARGVTLHAGSIEVGATLHGVGEEFFRIFPKKLLLGRLFDAAEVERSAPEVIIDQGTHKRLLPHEPNPIGQTILIGRLPVRVAGVIAPVSSWDPPEELNVYLPYTTVMHRILGSSNLRMIAVGVDKNVSTEAAEQAIEKLLVQRHGVKDFFTLNVDRMRKAEERSQRIFNILAVSIALASLIVAGIGVTNIMLMSVAQRSREIGIRMAVGARPGDIGLQFIIEATLMCLLGAAVGVMLARALGVAFMIFVKGFPMLFSTTTTVMAFVVPLALGVGFGMMPARRAAKLDPVEALARE